MRLVVFSPSVAILLLGASFQTSSTTTTVAFTCHSSPQRRSSLLVRHQASSSSAASSNDNGVFTAAEPLINGSAVNGSSAATVNDSTAFTDDDDDPRLVWREKVLAAAFRTMCGFRATETDRQRMRYLIQQLAAYNPTAAPAAAFYDPNNKDNDDDSSSFSSSSSSSFTTTTTTTTAPSLTGKWTLLYTDAPDILGLADNDSLGRLQRIGQECNQGTIANVIEWFPPIWAGALPWQLPQRALQKVVTKATASPAEPCKVNLVLQGLQVEWNLQNGDNDGGGDDDDDDDNNNNNNNTTTNTPLPSWLSFFNTNNPLVLQGPLTVPFGSFEILYLDDEIRIIRTNQGYYAINKRNTADTEWF